MNDTKDIQTIREALVNLEIHFSDKYLAATEALSRLEARLSAHQEVVSALEAILETYDIHGVVITSQVANARAALARSKEAK